MKRNLWTSNEILLIALIIGVILGHLASLGDIMFHPPFGTIASLVLALIIYMIATSIRTRSIIWPSNTTSPHASMRFCSCWRKARTQRIYETHS